MRVLLTLDFPPERGGIQRYLAGLVRHIYDADDLVIVGTRDRVWSSPDPGTFRCTVRYVTTPLSGLNKKWSLPAMIPAFARALRVGRGGAVVECGNVYSALVPWAVSYVVPLQYRVYTYGTELLPLAARSPVAWLLRRVLSRATVLYTLGAYTERLLARAGIATRMERTPPRIEITEIGPAARFQQRADPHHYGLLSVGRLVAHKGHVVLLRAVASITEFPLALTIVGSGPELPRLDKLSRELGIGDKVRFRPRLTDGELAREYREADVFVLPSLERAGGTEGFGIVLLEAMAVGLPVIATRAGGIPDVLGDDPCGILVPPESPSELADAIRRLRNDPAMGAALAERAYRRLLEHYVWK